MSDNQLTNNNSTMKSRFKINFFWWLLHFSAKAFLIAFATRFMLTILQVFVGGDILPEFIYWADKSINIVGYAVFFSLVIVLYKLAEEKYEGKKEEKADKSSAESRKEAIKKENSEWGGTLSNEEIIVLARN